MSSATVHRAGSRERPARILHAPWNVAGNPVGLSRAERELGFASEVMVLGGNPFGFAADFDLELGGREDLRAQLRRAAFALRALRRYDVFHFNFGSTIFMRRTRRRLYTELPLLKRLGKTILATFQGSDARPPSENPGIPSGPEYDDWERREQPRTRRLILDHADRVFFVNPDLRSFLPGAQFRPYACVDPRRVTPAPPPERGDEVVAIHAPSDRGTKGSEHVLAAVDRLRAQGLPLRLDLVEGVDHATAMARYAAADLAIDQLPGGNLGWYGGFAVEMMALGRPVLTRIVEDEPADNPFGEELPVVRITPETIERELRELVRDRERRMRIGAAGRDFVERHHDPRRIAAANLEGLVEIPAAGAPA